MAPGCESGHSRSTTASNTMETMPSFADLFDPNHDYDYFALAHEHPFSAQDGHFSLVNAGWLADCSLLAYLRDENDVKTRLTRAGGFDGATCIGFDREGAQCFVAHRPEGTIVCFRGTEVGEGEDLKADVAIRLVPEGDEAQNRKVHRGFQHSLDTIWAKVQRELTGGKIWFTGHSLGAALATLAADRHPGAHSLYTFGSPRVGDKRFGQGFRANAHRFVNNNDAVTRVPPAGLWAYRHIGDLVYLDEDGRLIDDPTKWQLLKAGLSGHLERIFGVLGDFRWGGFDSIPLDQLADHSPTDYAKHIWGNITGDR